MLHVIAVQLKYESENIYSCIQFFKRNFGDTFISLMRTPDQTSFSLQIYCQSESIFDTSQETEDSVEYTYLFTFDIMDSHKSLRGDKYKSLSYIAISITSNEATLHGIYGSSVLYVSLENHKVINI